MAVRDLDILIDFTTDADPLREINQQINQITRQTQRMGRAYDGVSNESQQMLNEMRTGWNNQRQALLRYRNDMIAAEYSYYQLARSSREYTGTTRDFMRAIYAAGDAQRRVRDAMLENDDRARMSMYQTIGTMAVMTTQARRISDNYERMGNPLYNVNRGALAVVDSVNRLANRSTAAAMALQLLGPTANMRQLLNMQRMITQGYMRMQMVAIGAAITSFFLYGALNKAAMQNKEYAQSLETMVSILRKAFQPMVDAFIAVMTPIYRFITYIGQLIIKFNEAYPTIAKIIQGIMMLIPVLTLILSPLAIGIGLFAGFRAALGYIWPMIAPVVTGLAAMSATVWIVAAAIVGLVAGFIYLYNNFAWFRNGVQTVLTAIKNGFITAFNFIKNSVIIPILNAVTTFVQQKLSQLKVFWSQNGAQIMGYVRVAMAFIAGFIRIQMGFVQMIFKTVWPIITGVVKVAWGLIRMIISGAINWITGWIKAALAVMQGDWQGAWDAIKGIFSNTWNDIKSIFKSMDFAQIGKDLINGLINGINSMVGSVAKTVTNIVGTIKDAFTKPLVIKSPSRLFMEYGVNTFQGYGIGMESQKSSIQSIVGDMASIPASYSPESSVTTTNSKSNSTIIFNPSIQVTASNGNATSIKQQVKEALDEAFDYLRTVYDVEVDY